MANVRKRLPLNVEGDFFVDSTCIDCDTCRQLAPRVFADSGDYSFVQHQPDADAERHAAVRALLACPTGSIGTVGRNDAHAVKHDFPLLLEEDVYYCGFNSPKSYGGNSYFIRHPAGNWLIDAPKFLPYLAGRLEELGGIGHIFLTHQDDVADADRYARHFGARRIIHRLELDSQPDAEVVLDGFERRELAPGFVVVPTPGHTAGHCCLLVSDRFLFTGDHLAWDRDEQSLTAFRRHCWHSWAEQTESMARLRDVRFEWVLPGHGQRVKLPPGAAAGELESLVEWMRAN